MTRPIKLWSFRLSVCRQYSLIKYSIAQYGLSSHSAHYTSFQKVTHHSSRTKPGLFIRRPSPMLSSPKHFNCVRWWSFSLFHVCIRIPFLFPVYITSLFCHKVASLERFKGLSITVQDSEFIANHNYVWLHLWHKNTLLCNYEISVHNVCWEKVLASTIIAAKAADKLHYILLTYSWWISE